MILDSIYPDDARITNQCEELINSKHEVFLFCLSYNPLFIKKEKINNINVYRYHCSSLTYKLSALANDVSFYNDILKKKIDDFILKLTQCRYLDIHKSEYKQKYKIDKFNFFNINDNFPYIKEYVVPDGLSDLSITYKIDLEKCEDFRINEEELINNL